MSKEATKPVSWVGSSYNDFCAFPGRVQDEMSYAFYRAQTGKKHEHAKPLRGFGGTGVLEIVTNHVGDTFRAVYTVKLPTAIYVLHAFQKKSKSSVKTTTQDMVLIRQRLKLAESDHKKQLGKRGSS